MRFPRLIICLACGLILGLLYSADAGTLPHSSNWIQGRNGSKEFVTAPQELQRGRGSLDDVVLFEDFESTAPGDLPPGWLQLDHDTAYCSWFERRSTWETYSGPGFPAHSGERFAMCHFNDHSVPNDDWLILPTQNLSGTITLSYWAAAQDGNFPESFEVLVSTGGIGPQDFSHVIYSGTNIGEVWQSYSHDLSAFAGAPFHLAFHYNATNEFAIKIDDIQLEATGTQTGCIAGVVTDDSGHVSYAAAQIPSLSRLARTDTGGVFLLSGIPVGTYNLFFTDEFHLPETVPNVVVSANDTTPVNANLTSRTLFRRHMATNSNPRAIRDFDTCSMILTMQDTVVIWDLDVSVTLRHSCVGDLDVYLRSPDSVWVQLAAHDSMNTGENMTNCWFDDQADLPFAAGQAPYTGHFRPVEPLSIWNGDSLIHRHGTSPYNRVWMLFVADMAARDTGSFLGFTMDIAWLPPASADDHHQPLPQMFTFDGNYPNPFNSETRFHFSLPSDSRIELVLYNLLGQEVARVASGRFGAGEHNVLFDAAGLTSGVYLARLTAGSASITRKMLLIK